MYSNSLVSVIMNCYNGEKYLRDALGSVINQTYKNWELIFWDNQSSDKSAKIFKSYNDKRFIYYFSPEYCCLNDARNHAIARARGEFIAFLDVDDMWVPQKLEKQMLYFEDEKVGVVYGNYWFVNKNKETKKIKYSKKLPSGYILNELLCSYVVGLLTIVVRRSAFININKRFDSRFSMVGDFDLMVRLAVDWIFIGLQEPVASYRWHGENTSIRFKEKHIKELELWCEEMESHIVISKQRGLKKQADLVLYLKAMNYIENYQILKAIKAYYKLPVCIEKMKLLIALITPRIILNKMRS